MKDLLRRALVAGLALVPLGPARRLFRLWLSGLARGAAPEALRRLFPLSDDLEDEINRACLRYDELGHVKHRLTGYHDFFIQRIKPGERVLDVGCGQGWLAHDLVVQAGARVVGLDFDATALALARTRFRHPDLSFLEADATQALPAGPWDVVVLSNALEHLDRRPAFLARLKAELKPAKFLIRVPALDRDWRVPLRRELGLAYFSDKTHFTEYTAATLAAELTQAGLEIIHLQANWGELWAEARCGSGQSDG